MKKETKVYLILIIIVILIISGIFWIMNNKTPEEETIRCIAEKSKIIVSPTCSWCEKQKQDLGEYVDYFEFVDISQNPEILKQYNIRGTPSWIIEEEVYPGYQTVEELKQITGC